MKSVVIFDTRYGNTEKIARSLSAGLTKAGVESLCVNVRGADASSLSGYDLICLGAPTEAFSASKPMKEFLAKAGNTGLSGRFGFAFDTKLRSRLSGSAAKLIEKQLEGWNLRIILPRESAIVSTVRGGAEIRGAKLDEGEEARFEQLGIAIGASLLRSRETTAR